MTTAVRSWRPWRLGGSFVVSDWWRGPLAQLDERPGRALRVQEGDARPAAPVARNAIHHRDARRQQAVDGRLEVLDLEAQVVDPLAAPREEARDGPGGVRPFHQLDLSPRQREERDPGAHPGQRLDALRRAPEDRREGRGR